MNRESIEAFVKAYPEFAFALLAWILIWKVLALAKALHHKAFLWFLIILLINTFGLLDIYYYYFGGKKKEINETHQ